MRREFDTKIWKTGNSYVITIPAKIIQKYGLKEDNDVTIIIKK